MADTGSTGLCSRLVQVWQGADPANIGIAIPAWPATGVVVLGDFAHIQRFVLRPVPGAKGAAKGS